MKMRLTTLRSIRYTGGKQLVAGWIASLLPWDYKSLYVEPCGGMAAVLLARPPVRAELIADTNDAIVNLWRVIRDRPDELAAFLAHTPVARSEFEAAIAGCANSEEDPVRRAGYAAVQLHFSYRATLSGNVSGNWNAHDRYRRTYLSPQDVARLAERMRWVRLESRPALQTLDGTRRRDDAVIYLDPPYPSADNSFYQSTAGTKPSEISVALLAQAGRVAVSGYPGEWDCLGWRRHEQQTRKPRAAARGVEARTECLWTNYDPATMRRD